MQTFDMKKSGTRGTRRAGLVPVLAAVVLAMTVPSGAVEARQDQQRQRMYHDVKPGVVVIATLVEAQIAIDLGDHAVTGSAHLWGGGSGFLVSPDGYVVTSGHVIQNYHADGDDELKALLLHTFLADEYLPLVSEVIGRPLTALELAVYVPQLIVNAEIGIVRQLHVILQNGESYPGEVKQYSPMMSPVAGRISFPGITLPTGKDVSIVKIEGRNFPTVAIGDSNTLSSGDDIHVGGYPSVVMSNELLSRRTALEPSFTRGGISGIRAAVAGNEVVQIDAAVTHGNSGGPVFNNQGQVIGIASLGSVGATASGDPTLVQGFNFAIPTSTIMEFVRAEGLTPSRGLFDELWRDALDAYYGGRWAEAVTGFDEVLRVQANLPDAISMRQTAIANRSVAPDTSEASDDMPWMVMALVAVGLALVATSFYFRRRTAPAMAGGAPAGVAAGNGQPRLPPSGTRLVVKEGPLQGNRFPITASGIKIGRDPVACQVVLSESATSREHAIIAPSGANGEIVLRNLSGTNPTYVNGRPVQEAVLSPGDRIRIANSVLTFEHE